MFFLHNNVADDVLHRNISIALTFISFISEYPPYRVVKKLMNSPSRKTQNTEINY